jgi:hypothetical protein
MKRADDTDDSMATLRGTLGLSEAIVRQPLEEPSLGDLTGAFRRLFGCAAWGVLPPHLSPVEGDMERLGQVPTNLVGDAIKFSPEYSAIILRVRVSGGGLIINAQDKGLGISVEALRALLAQWEEQRV